MSKLHIEKSQADAIVAYLMSAVVPAGVGAELVNIAKFLSSLPLNEEAAKPPKKKK